MKIRTDFVTNSSSSSFMCICIPRDMEDIVFLANGTTEEEICQKAYDEGENYFALNGKDMTVAVGESGVEYVGWPIYESDLYDKTLKQLKEDFARVFMDTYNMELKDEDIIFEYGEIYL